MAKKNIRVLSEKETNQVAKNIQNKLKKFTDNFKGKV